MQRCRPSPLAWLRLLPLLLLGLWLGMAGARAQGAPAPAASVDELVRLLEDEASRAALIARLRAADPAATPALPPEVEPTFARQLAEYSQAVAEQA
ncbi:hypothetical protein, partial [Teichococcus cervicalis]|uniref:hypothetical protein n=1 Tax=Teichococcus cervicalis TaxID=204525 RepID=UPI000590C15A